MDEHKPGVPAPEAEAPSEVHYAPRTDDSYGYYDDPYGYNPSASASTQVIDVRSEAVPAATSIAARPGGSIQKPPPGPPPTPPDSGDDDEGMLRMSFMEHLEELRTRILRAVYGLVVAFVISLLYAGQLWDIIQEPATTALKHLNVVPPKLAMIEPMEGFSIIWMKLPLLCSVFIASPWILYQAWAFVAPGLYLKERKWAIPGILATTGLFISGGLFAYFLAFRFGLEFLLGIGMMNGVQPVVTITRYFDLFINVTLGIALVFELPVLIFFLTLIRIVSPRFLLKHTRYAVLAITIVAAVVTPTPDFFNMMLFAVPMTVLYFVGVFAGYIVVLKREGKSMPWKIISLIVLGVLAVIGGVLYLMVAKYGYHFVQHWPFFVSPLK